MRICLSSITPNLHIIFRKTILQFRDALERLEIAVVGNNEDEAFSLR